MPGPKTRIRPRTAGAQQLLSLMELKGWSQAEVAQWLNWSRPKVYRALAGIAELTVKEAFQVQDELTDGEVSARAWTLDLPARRG